MGRQITRLEGAWLGRVGWTLRLDKPLGVGMGELLFLLPIFSYPLASPSREGWMDGGWSVVLIVFFFSSRFFLSVLLLSAPSFAKFIKEIIRLWRYIISSSNSRRRGRRVPQSTIQHQFNHTQHLPPAHILPIVLLPPPTTNHPRHPTDQRPRLPSNMPGLYPRVLPPHPSRAPDHPEDAPGADPSGVSAHVQVSRPARAR